MAQNFYIFVKNIQKGSRKAPEFWRDFNLATSLAIVGSPLSDDQIEVCLHMHSYIHIPVCLQTGM